MSRNGVVGIIGGGVAGLSAGGYLARNGYHVKLFEANAKLGGCSATTTIGGYTFNDGALYVVLPGILDHVFRKLGLDRPALLPFRRITASMSTVLPNESIVTLRDGPDLTVMRKEDPPDMARIQEEIGRALEKWEPVLRLFEGDILLHPFSHSRMLLKGWRHLPKLRGSVATEIRALFSDQAVMAAMSGALLFSGLPPEKTPVMSLLGLIAMLREGFYLPEGGMNRVPAAPSCGLSEHGGEIHLNAKVNRVRVENGQVCGVELEERGYIPVDAVISTVSGMLTANKLLDPDDVPASMLRRAENAPLSHKALCLQLGLANKIDVDTHLVNILPMMDEQWRVFDPQEDVSWPIFSVPTVTMPELAPPGGSIVEMYPTIPQNLPAEKWDDERTARTVEAALKALERRYRVDVAEQRVLSPRFFQNQMRLYRGAVYGLSPTADPRAQFPHKTPIKRLFQAGQTTYPGYGVSFSAMSGIFAAEALVRS